MALVQTDLKTALLSLFQKMKQAEMSEEEYAGNLAAIFTDYIKTATVTVKAGIPVSTTGTMAAQSGATTGPGSGSIA